MVYETEDLDVACSKACSEAGLCQCSKCRLDVKQLYWAKKVHYSYKDPVPNIGLYIQCICLKIRGCTFQNTIKFLTLTGAVQLARQSAPTALWERWVQTRHWEPSRDLVDQATGKSSFAPVFPSWIVIVWICIFSYSYFYSFLLLHCFTQVSTGLNEQAVWLHLGAYAELWCLHPCQAKVQQLRAEWEQAPWPSSAPCLWPFHWVSFSRYV